MLAWGMAEGFSMVSFAVWMVNCMTLARKDLAPHPIRGGDGRLTLKGGVREVLASELLHRLGVSTFRSLSLVETGESLWRGDEPSPTRSSVLVRLGRSHIRFGTFERLHYLRRPDLIRRLLDHVIDYYYPHLLEIPNPKERDCAFYRELVARTADLAAQWLVAGFCHGVLNTDNMAITGESFDYGPYVFLEHYDLGFTAAYFDYYGRYAYGNQPAICAWNLEKLQIPLSSVMPLEEMQAALKTFGDRCQTTYLKLMLKRLGWADISSRNWPSLSGRDPSFSQPQHHQLSPILCQPAARILP